MSNTIRQQYPQHFRVWTTSRVQWMVCLLVAAALLVIGFWSLEFSWQRMANGLTGLGKILWLMVPPDPGWGPRLLEYGHALAETLAIAMLGTSIAAVLAFPVGFLAARNTTINAVVRFMARRSLDTLRGVDILIWALIWINVVGLGPFAGVLALACADVGSFGKLFSEAIEASDHKPLEGLKSTGAGRLHQLRFGVLPQIWPVILSQVLYFFESNTRSATIIGIVGAGGIGFILAEQIRTLELQQMSFVVLMIWLTVSLIDLVCTRLRFAIIGAGTQPE